MPTQEPTTDTRDDAITNGPHESGGFRFSFRRVPDAGEGPHVLVEFQTPDAEPYRFRVRSLRETTDLRRSLRSALGRALNEERWLSGSIAEYRRQAPRHLLVWVVGDPYSGDHAACYALRELGLAPALDAEPPRWRPPLHEDPLRRVLDPAVPEPERLAAARAVGRILGEPGFVRAPVHELLLVRDVRGSVQYGRFLFVRRPFPERVFEAECHRDTVPPSSLDSTWEYARSVIREGSTVAREITFDQMRKDPLAVCRGLNEWLRLGADECRVRAAADTMYREVSQRFGPEVRLDAGDPH